MRLLFLFLAIPAIGWSQTKSITLEDVYKKGTFRTDPVSASFEESKPASPSVNWERFADAQGKKIGRPDDIIASEAKPNFQLLRTKTESIYRRSSKSLLYLFNTTDSSLVQIGGDTKSLHPQFSPDGQYISYVQNNNLMLFHIPTATTQAVTTDGRWNFIINGNCDWVYEEEFEFSRAYEWSPKGNYIAYYRFDESGVKEFNMTMYDNSHNSDYRYKYPKAGDDNSVVEIYIYDVKNATKAKAQYEAGDIYIPRIKWTTDDRQLVVFWMNRHQNVLKLLSTDATTGNSSPLYEEIINYFVEIIDDWCFLNDVKLY
ncbi:MAG: DPP IV N-terminal domain-containing protein, partial [Sphingomonadales bacterium]